MRRLVLILLTGSAAAFLSAYALLELPFVPQSWRDGAFSVLSFESDRLSVMPWNGALIFHDRVCMTCGRGRSYDHDAHCQFVRILRSSDSSIRGVSLGVLEWTSWHSRTYSVFEVRISILLIAAMFGAWPAAALGRYLLRRRRGRRSGLCIKCGYDLTGNVSGVCPECSTAIEGATRTETGH